MRNVPTVVPLASDERPALLRASRAELSLACCSCKRVLAAMHSPCALQDLSGEGEGDRHVARACLSVRDRRALPAEPHPLLRASLLRRLGVPLAVRFFTRTKAYARFHRCKGCQVGRSCGASPPFPFPSSSPLRCNSAAPQTHLKTPFPPHAPTRTSTQARLHASALAKDTLFHAAANTLSPVSQLGSGTVATGGALLGNGRAGGRMMPVRFVV